MRFPITDQQQPWPYLSLFSRCGRFSVNNAHFSYPFRALLFDPKYENVFPHFLRRQSRV